MFRTSARIVLAAGAMALSTAALADPVEYTADLAPVNSSGVSGDATVTLDGNELTVEIVASGLEPGRLHPQHIHGFVNDKPSSLDFVDFNSNGLIEHFEGELFIGPPIKALTVSPDGNPLTDFPSDSDLDFKQTYVLDDALLDSLAPLSLRAIELHGLTVNGEYDPTMPVAGGLLRQVGNGGTPVPIPLPPAAWAGLFTMCAFKGAAMLRRRRSHG